MISSMYAGYFTPTALAMSRWAVATRIIMARPTDGLFAAPTETQRHTLNRDES